jgi:hypothetical protein
MLSKLKSEKPSHLIRKWKKDMKRYFSKEAWFMVLNHSGTLLYTYQKAKNKN